MSTIGRQMGVTMPEYEISGVDRESGLDTSLVIHADSEANAKAKAELKGIVVTGVRDPRAVDVLPARRVPEPTRYEYNPPPQPPQPQQVIVNVVQNNNNLYDDRAFSPIVAAFLSLIIPGLGQIYKGQLLNGIVWFIVVAIGYAALIVPGLVLHILCILGAASGSRRR